MSGMDQKDFERLLNVELPPLGELLTEENLQYAGIASKVDKGLCFLNLSTTKSLIDFCLCRDVGHLRGGCSRGFTVDGSAEAGPQRRFPKEG